MASPRLGFIIVGTPRSGTTLAQRLANEIPGVKTPPETQFLDFVRLHRDVCTFPMDTDGIRRMLGAFKDFRSMGMLDLDPDGVIARLSGSCASATAVFSAIVEDITGPAEIYGEKSPNHLLAWRALTSALPHLRVIWVVRDARSVVASLLRAPWTRTRHDRMAERWAFDQREFAKAHATLGARLLLLRYEDVVHDSTDTRERIATFLRASTHSVVESVRLEQITRPGEFWKRNVVGPVTQDRVAAWRHELSPRQALEVAAICRTQLRSFGYDRDLPNVLSAASTFLRMGRRNVSRLRVRWERAAQMRAIEDALHPPGDRSSDGAIRAH